MNPEYSEQIEKLYLEMYDILRIYAQCSFAEEPLAEEAVQETFRIACQKPENLCESINPKGWLVNTLRFTIRNMKRNRKHALELLSNCLVLEKKRASYIEDKLTLQFLYGNVSDLEEFKLIKEMAVDRRSLLEMANARGISVSTCKKRVQRAKEKLKNKIKKEN